MHNIAIKGPTLNRTRLAQRTGPGLATPTSGAPKYCYKPRNGLLLSPDSLWPDDLALTYASEMSCTMRPAGMALGLVNY